MSVTAAEITKLARHQTNVLTAARGDREAEARTLGDLRFLVVSRTGWRPDGPARVRTFLSALLDQYLLKGPEDASGRAHSRAVQVRAISIYWGITEFPRSSESVGISLADANDGEPLSQNLTSMWARNVVGNSAVLEWVNLTWLPSQLADVADVPSSSVRVPKVRYGWTDAPSDWPQLTWPQSSGPRIDEAEAIMDAATEVLKATHDADWPAPDSKEARQILREAVRHVAESQYFTHPDTQLMRRDLRKSITVPWFDDDTVAMFLEDDPLDLEIDEDVDFAPQLATVVQMLFYSVSKNESALLAATAAERTRRVSFSNRWMAAKSWFRVSESTSHGESEQSVSTGTIEETAVLARIIAARGLAMTVVDSRPGDFLGRAEIIRRETDKNEKLRLVRQYLSLRQNMPWGSIQIHEVIQLNLADQSVHLDLVYMHQDALANELDYLINNVVIGSPQSLIYRSLTQRNAALLRADHKDFRSSVGLLEHGFADIDFLLADKALTPKAAIEVRHQLALAGAGIYVRAVEALFSSKDRGAVARQYARLALISAWETNELLRQLESEGLGTERYKDKHISTVAWRVQSQLLRIRVLLAVHTLVESGLSLPPMARLGEPTDAFDFTLPTIKLFYLRVFETSELAEANKADLLRLALWISFLNERNIPIAPGVPKSFQDHMEVFDGFKRKRSVDTPVEARFDVAAASKWFATKSQDAGIVHKIPTDGPVAHHLQSKSGGSFGAWRNSAFGKRVTQEPDAPQCAHCGTPMEIAGTSQGPHGPYGRFICATGFCQRCGGPCRQTVGQTLR